MTETGWQDSPPERLVAIVQELSLARDLDSVMHIVRSAARDLTGADGATFVLREEGDCYYADEDAISPLWKGQRFPASACISGWVMDHGTPALIEDIYADSRIPDDVYRPTFVRSLAMVPIRPADPVAAIGNYWAIRHQPNTEELRLLQALADSTSIAMENVALYADLERRVAERTRELEGLRAYLDKLTTREREVLEVTTRGLTSKEAARELGMSHRTVEVHRDRIRKKLGIRSLTELARLV